MMSWACACVGSERRKDPPHTHLRLCPPHLEDDDHVKVLGAKDDALEVDVLDVAVGDDEGRLVRDGDEAVAAGLHEHHLLEGRAAEAEVAHGHVKVAEAAARGGGVVLDDLLAALHELLEGLVELGAQAALALLLAVLVDVVVGAVAAVQRLARSDNLGEELDVLELLLADHDGVAQVEVQQHRVLALAGLEDAVADVGVQELHLLALVGDEAQAVGVRLERAERLAAGDGGPHGEVREARHLVARQHELALLDEVGRQLGGLAVRAQLLLHGLDLRLDGDEVAVVARDEVELRGGGGGGGR